MTPETIDLTDTPGESSTASNQILDVMTVEHGIDRWGGTISSDQHRAWTKISGSDSNGDWFMAEAVVPSRHSMPLHVHEAFHIEVGGKINQLSPGASLLASRKIPHRWQNVDTSNGRRKRTAVYLSHRGRNTAISL